MSDRRHDVGPTARLVRWLAVAAAVVAAAGTALFLTRTGDGGGSADLSVDFTPAPGSFVPANEVRDELAAAIQRLLAEPFVSIESVGFTEGRRSDFEATVDVVGRRVSSRELISDGVEIGAPRSPRALTSELVVLGNEAWLRVLQVDDAPDTPFQFIDATGSADQYIEGAYTHLSRVFDSLSVLAALLATAPFDAEQLESRTIDGRAVGGTRAVFDSMDVAGFLESEGLAAVSGEIVGSTTFELWYDNGGLRQLVATGTQFQDGEALQTAARINYRVETSLNIEAPLNTVAR